MVPDPSRALSEGALQVLASRRVPPLLKGRAGKRAKRLGLPASRPWKRLSKSKRDAFLYGDGAGGGLTHWLENLYQDAQGELADFLSQFRSQTICPECEGARLNPIARSVRLGGHTIHELSDMTPGEVLRFLESFERTELGRRERTRLISETIFKEIATRLRLLLRVGLSYLTLSRRSDTLSGGEAQRIRLASQLGSHLRGVLYILDEPTIGLHVRDKPAAPRHPARAAAPGELGRHRRARRGDDPERRPRDRPGARGRLPGRRDRRGEAAVEDPEPSELCDRPVSQRALCAGSRAPPTPRHRYHRDQGRACPQLEGAGRSLSARPAQRGHWGLGLGQEHAGAGRPLPRCAQGAHRSRRPGGGTPSDGDYRLD